jgi:hypothetical protein
MAGVMEYEIVDIRPKMAEYEYPFFILRLETIDGPTLELKIKKQALKYLADAIKDMPD